MRRCPHKCPLDKVNIDHYLSLEEEIACYNSKVKSVHDLLITTNIPNAKKIAAKYIRKFPQCADEIMSAALYGLCLAPNHWDYHKGAKFSTYCRNWIYKYILEYISTYVSENTKISSLEKMIDDGSLPYVILPDDIE